MTLNTLVLTLTHRFPDQTLTRPWCSSPVLRYWPGSLVSRGHPCLNLWCSEQSRIFQTLRTPLFFSHGQTLNVIIFNLSILWIMETLSDFALMSDRIVVFYWPCCFFFNQSPFWQVPCPFQCHSDLWFAGQQLSHNAAGFVLQTDPVHGQDPVPHLQPTAICSGKHSKANYYYREWY